MPAEIDISHRDNGATIYAPKAKAAILASVFQQSLPARDDGAPGAGAASKRIRVGEELKTAKDRLTRYGRRLSGLNDAVIADYIAGLLSILDGQVCHIAVLGQMNSGKSTLINAFIEQPDFLPTEITPWTTVVTNLYFGLPGSPTAGAVFDFFDADEWQRLAEGSTRVRTLTERLIPDFDWAAFYRQVGDMRERARQQLGPEFEALLGQQHSFADIAPELLQKYVCAEAAEEAGEAAYSLITKAAHLYFDLGGFFYPTVVIDTPGINDPFLVRDEITRQNLERANVFIIVVTARQPLSDADVDLLRILRGLDKDRIIVFVNKIDEVDDFTTVEAAILQRVKGVLEREFPSARIPVIMGSARWATDDRSAALPPPSPKIGNGNGLPAEEIAALGEGGSFWMSDRHARETLAAEQALMRSGLPALALAVSDMMRTGPIADCLSFTTVALAAIAANCAARAEARVAMMARLLDSARAGTMPGEDELAALRSTLGEAEAVAEELGRLVANLQHRFAEQIDSGLAALREALTTVLEDHVAAMAAPDAGGSPLTMMPLRAALEGAFSQGFVRIYGGIVDLEREGEAHIQDLVRRAHEAGGLAVVFSPLPVLKLAPPLGALADPAALASGGTIEAQLWRQPLAPEERTARLQNTIRTQFAAVIDRLCAAASQDMARATGFMLDHFRMSVLHCLEASRHERQACLDAHLAVFAAGGDALGSYSEGLAEALETLHAEAATCRSIVAELAAPDP